ncbi:MAG: hypothetical protein AAFX50_24700, partial [Acidobacteriota bacterium]
LLENPNFDRALAPWISFDFVWDSEDHDEAPSSGSIESLPAMDGVADHPCIDVTTVEEGLYASMRALLQDLGDVGASIQLELAFFAAADCQGALLTVETMSRVEGDTASEWLHPSVWIPVPTTAVSAVPILRFESTDGSGAALVDRLSLIPALFADGFESGDTGAWSSTIP